MLNKLKRTKLEKTGKGFTIIEVMIVLAIAGLILLIVFLAVPALQRTSRNTQIKNDAGSISGAISSFESNNNGSVPTTISGTGTIAISGGAGTTADQQKVGGSTTVNVVTSAPAATAPALGTISVFFGHTCEAAGGTFTPGTAGVVSARSTAVYYSTETSGGQQQQCIDS